MEPNWRIIEQENRGLSIQSACALGEGWNSRAYLVNNALVFRFPKRPDQWGELRREIDFLDFAADLLPLSVPRYVGVNPESLAAACGYAMYRYLAGDLLDLRVMSQTERGKASDCIATFLRALHRLEPSPEIGDALPREDARKVAEYYLERTEREIAPKLQMRDAKALVAQFEAYLSRSENFLFRPVVLHADLGRTHLLMEDSAVVAVLDFGDINWGDPDYDFVYLFNDFGPVFVEAVALSYGHPDLESLRSKLRYYAVVDQVDTILHGGGRALDGQETEAWRRLRQFVRRKNCE
ncbi:MAG: aminoglycoside phosphotransferase family protein [Candidatus Hydrogenedentes bacterium]|nr:aminoglycoside phosphotransferase family protein [Candidatus Hydrogenedentota bacterium]